MLFSHLLIGSLRKISDKMIGRDTASFWRKGKSGISSLLSIKNLWMALKCWKNFWTNLY